MAPKKANAVIVKEVNDAGPWFHAKKTRPIWVRKLEQEETVKTLEGEERVPAGNYLCRGETGDIWPQTEERLTSKYIVTDEVGDKKWRKCLPKPECLRSDAMTKTSKIATSILTERGISDRSSEIPGRDGFARNGATTYNICVKWDTWHIVSKPFLERSDW